MIQWLSYYINDTCSSLKDFELENFGSVLVNIEGDDLPVECKLLPSNCWLKRSVPWNKYVSTP